MFRRIQHEYPDIIFKNLGVGEGIATCEPTSVTTVLGSCVAVTFHCRRTRCGAIFHALLPTRGMKHSVEEYGPFRFADEGVRYFVGALKEKGCRLVDIECKVFGGANAYFADDYAVGTKNSAVAIATLKTFGLEPTACDVGGARGRKLFFITHTGEVFMKRLSASEGQTVT